MPSHAQFRGQEWACAGRVFKNASTASWHSIHAAEPTTRTYSTHLFPRPPNPMCQRQPRHRITIGSKKKQKNSVLAPPPPPPPPPRGRDRCVGQSWGGIPPSSATPPFSAPSQAVGGAWGWGRGWSTWPTTSCQLHSISCGLSAPGRGGDTKEVSGH